MIVLVAGAGYFAFVVRVADSSDAAGGWALRLAGLVAAGFVWLLAVQSLPPTAVGLSKAPLVLYSPAASGYYFEARYGEWTPGEFLAGYEERMGEGDVLHVGTHPPGLFLLHRGFIDLFEANPGLAKLVASTRPAAVRDVEEQLLPMIGRREITIVDAAALWSGTLLTHLVAVATCVPLFLLVKRSAGLRAAWYSAAFWPLVPALAVFLPKSDALFPFLGMLFLWLWLEAVARGSIWRGLLAGGVVWCGLLLSLALLPVGLLGVVLAVVECRRTDMGKPWRRLLIATLAAGVAFVAMTLAVWLSANLNLPAVWAANLRNHSAFYDEYPRTYWKWLLVNPLELVLALGVPIAVLVLRFGWRRGSAGLAIPCFVVWGLLWVSGKNAGEAARLWLLLMPWPLWMAFAGGLDRTSETEESMRDADDEPLVRALLAMQLVVSAATVARVNGFPFPGS